MKITNKLLDNLIAEQLNERKNLPIKINPKDPDNLKTQLDLKTLPGDDQQKYIGKLSNTDKKPNDISAQDFIATRGQTRSHARKGAEYIKQDTSDTDFEKMVDEFTGEETQDDDRIADSSWLTNFFSKEEWSNQDEWHHHIADDCKGIKYLDALEDALKESKIQNKEKEK